MTRWRTFPYLAAGSGTGLLILTGLLVLTPWVEEADAELRQWVLSSPGMGASGSGPLKGCLRAAALLGQRGVTLPLLLTVAVCRSWTSRSTGPLRAVLTGLLLLAVTGTALKYGLGRAAPSSGTDGLYLGGHSFPSGHTANAVVTGGLLVRLLWRPARDRTTELGLALASPTSGLAAGLIAGAAVLLLDYHWASDVAGGLLLGLCLLALLDLLPSPARHWRFTPLADAHHQPGTPVRRSLTRRHYRTLPPWRMLSVVRREPRGYGDPKPDDWLPR